MVIGSREQMCEQHFSTAVILNKPRLALDASADKLIYSCSHFYMLQISVVFQLCNDNVSAKVSILEAPTSCFSSLMMK